MSYPHYDLVQKAHADLKAEGLIKARSTQDEVEQDKGLITRRAAWYVFDQRDATHGLLEKTSGNNSLGYSVDWILRQSDGVGWDITTDDGQNALPVNGDQHPPDPAYIPRWRQPTAELAQMPTTPTPPPDQGSDTDARLKAIEDALNAMLHLQTEQGAQIHHMMTATWAGSVALALRMNFGVTCPPMPED